MDIADADFVVGLFRQLVGVIDRRERNKRKVFKTVYQPLYTRLSHIANDYYQLIADIQARLNRPKPNLKTLIGDIEKSRIKINIARNGIIGEAIGLAEDPWRSKFIWTRPIRSLLYKNKLVDLSRPFAESIVNYFYVRESESAATAVLEMLESHIRDSGGEVSPALIDIVREQIAEITQQLERSWTQVSYHYSILQRYCM